MPIKLYVGNLPSNCPNETIRDLFESYGHVTDSTVIKNYAFVHFEKDEDANYAVRELNGTKLSGKQITVEVSKSKGKDKGGNSGDTNRGSTDRRQPRRDNARRNENQNHRGSNMGGILGSGPGADSLAPPAFENFGILSAVSTLAAAAEQQRNLQNQRNSQPFPDYRTQRDPLQDISRDQDFKRDASEGSKLVSDNRGYVIYERYYVDPTHPLLKGLPLPELSRVEDSFVSHANNSNYNKDYAPRTDSYASVDGKRSDLYSQVDVDPYRSRSPLNSRRDMSRDYDCRR